MQKTILGRTGLEVTRVSFGGIPIQRLSEEEAIKVVQACLDRGINFIDTARGYTDSEHKIGLAIKGRRNECYLASKGNVNTKEEMWEALRESLKQLSVKKIDLYQIHNVSDEERLKIVMGPGGALEALKEAREQGLIDFIGITSHKPEILLKAVETNEFDTIQFPYNIVEKQFEPVIKAAKKLNVGTIVMKPLAGGTFRNAKASLKYILEQDLDVIIPGMQSIKEVEENISAANGPMTDEERKALQEEAESLKGELCRRCGYCTPCPQGINIPMIYTFMRFFELYGMHDVARKRYAELSVHADACTECGICETKCPYNLKIREAMKKAQKMLG